MSLMYHLSPGSLFINMPKALKSLGPSSFLKWVDCLHMVLDLGGRSMYSKPMLYERKSVLFMPIKKFSNYHCCPSSFPQKISCITTSGHEEPICNVWVSRESTTLKLYS